MSKHIDEFEARETLMRIAREYGTGNARGGDVIAAAIRYTSECFLKTWGYKDLVRDLEKVAQGAEEIPDE